MDVSGIEVELKLKRELGCDFDAVQFSLKKAKLELRSTYGVKDLLQAFEP